MRKVISVDGDVLGLIESAKSADESVNSALRRLLGLPAYCRQPFRKPRRFPLNELAIGESRLFDWPPVIGSNRHPIFAAIRYEEKSGKAFVAEPLVRGVLVTRTK